MRCRKKKPLDVVPKKRGLHRGTAERRGYRRQDNWAEWPFQWREFGMRGWLPDHSNCSQDDKQGVHNSHKQNNCHLLLYSFRPTNKHVFTKLLAKLQPFLINHFTCKSYPWRNRQVIHSIRAILALLHPWFSQGLWQMPQWHRVYELLLCITWMQRRDLVRKVLQFKAWWMGLISLPKVRNVVLRRV